MGFRIVQEIYELLKLLSRCHKIFAHSPFMRFSQDHGFDNLRSSRATIESARTVTRAKMSMNPQ